MNRRAKLLERARHGTISFEEFETLLAQNGWVKRKSKRGSHRVWISPRGIPHPIQPDQNGEAKKYQLEQFFKEFENA